MATTPSQGASGPPPKPWERAGSSSGPVPFKPPSTGSTSDVVEASGTAKHGEIVSTSVQNSMANTNAVGRPLPTRPWENNYGSNTYGGYNSGLNYNSGYGSGMYNSYGGAYGGMSGGMYGNSMYRGGYGGGLSGSGMYGGMSNSGFGGPMGGYGMGIGGPNGPQDPNNPPLSPPGFWISFLRVMEGVVNVFGRISFLVDQNTQSVHLFMSALLQATWKKFDPSRSLQCISLITSLYPPVLSNTWPSGALKEGRHSYAFLLWLFDRGGMLYGELARFVLRILGLRRKSRKVTPPGPNSLPLPGPPNMQMNQKLVEGPKTLPGGSWDGVWGSDSSS